MHCIMKSILNDGPQLRHDLGKNPPHYKGWSVQDFSKLPYQTYEIPDFMHLHVQCETAPPIVLALGRGIFENPPNIQSLDEFNTIQASENFFSKFQEDFSLLKYSLQNSQRDTCLQMNSSDLEVNTEAWAVGFPSIYTLNNNPQKYVLKSKVFNTVYDLKMRRGHVGIYPEESWFDSNRFFY